jgi:putative membrane protein
VPILAVSKSEEYLLASEESLKRSMETAAKMYSSLFRLPSDQVVILLLAVSCIIGGFLSTLIVFTSSYRLAYSLFFGISVFFVSILMDYLTNKLVLKQEAIFNLRREMFLSLFSWAIWLCFIFSGCLLSLALNDLGWWIKLSLLGFSAATLARMVVFSATTQLNSFKVFAASFLQPIALLALTLVSWSGLRPLTLIPTLLFVLFSAALTSLASYVFLHQLDRLGSQTLGMRSLSLFRAFMLNWVLGLNAPFEQLLESLGEKKDVEMGFIKFASSETETIIVVPSVHPGPFKNIGSSLLPSLTKTALERERGCVACVPHGLMGHEFDLASQEQNQKVIDLLVTSIPKFGVCQAKVSPFVKVTNGLATACCQVFGMSALISFTLAPRTIEDLPPDLGVFVGHEAKKYGYGLCAVVNAHNSIDGNAEMLKSLDSLENVAIDCLKKVASTEQLPFQIGSATVLPKEFSLEDGMGAGGITVVVIQCGGQKAAYVVIDGNNMVSGFREEILSSLSSLGIDEGEVFTTDTHAVSALILDGHGYHPIGEAMDKKRLINYIMDATSAAIAKLNSAKATCGNIVAKDVTVLGANKLETLCRLIDKSLQTAKKSVVPLFFGVGVLLMVFLLFI